MTKINLLDKDKFFMTKRVSLSADDEFIDEIEHDLKLRFIKTAEEHGNDMERLGLEVATERKKIPGYYAIEIRAFFIVSDERKYSKKPRVIYGKLRSSYVYRCKEEIEKLLKNSGATQSIQSEILCTLHYLYNSAILYEKSHQKFYYPLQELIHEVKEDYDNMSYRAMRFCHEDEIEIDLFNPISKENIAYKKLFDKFSTKVDELYNKMDKDDE